MTIAFQQNWVKNNFNCKTRRGDGGGGVALPYISYTGTCHLSGYGFDRSLINRVSNSKISEDFLKIGSEHHAF